MLPTAANIVRRAYSSPPSHSTPSGHHRGHILLFLGYVDAHTSPSSTRHRLEVVAGEVRRYCSGRRTHRGNDLPEGTRQNRPPTNVLANPKPRGPSKLP
jgi:hypothetical protein